MPAYAVRAQYQADGSVHILDGNNVKRVFSERSGTNFVSFPDREGTTKFVNAQVPPRSGNWVVMLSVKTILVKIHDPDVSKTQPVSAENYLETVARPALATWNMQLTVVDPPIPARVVLSMYHLVGRMIYLDSDITAFLHVDLRIGFRDYGFYRVGGLWKLQPYPATQQSINLADTMMLVPCLHIKKTTLYPNAAASSVP